MTTNSEYLEKVGGTIKELIRRVLCLLGFHRNTSIKHTSFNIIEVCNKCDRIVNVWRRIYA